MKLLAALVASLILGLGTYSYVTGYRSAFEADQACHAEKWNAFSEDIGVDCDHDLETKQWILFVAGSNHQAAQVVKRFRY